MSIIHPSESQVKGFRIQIVDIYAILILDYGYNSTMRTMTYPHHNARPLFEQALVSLLLGFLVFLAAGAAYALGYQFQYANRIFPGVSVAGIDVGGLSEQEAAARVTQQLAYPLNGRLLLRSDLNSWMVTPANMGLYLDPESTAKNAMQVGRRGGLFHSLKEQYDIRSFGTNISPLLVFDQRMAYQFLETVAAQVDQPVIEPSLHIEGVDVVVQPGQVGRYVDKAATLALISAQVQSLQDGVVPVVIREEKPVIEDVSGQAELARQILSQPLNLTMPEGQSDQTGPWTFKRADLADMLSFQRVIADDGSASYELGLNHKLLGDFLYGLADTIAVFPQNARFIFNDDTHRLDLIQNAVIGRSLDVESTLRTIDEKLMAGQHDVTLQLITDKPQITDDTTGEQLGITELVSAQTSYFYGSSADRIHNIRTAAAAFHGLLVAPGETFSMASALGDISLDNGYAEALIIVGDQTVQGVGGGVCQVSTTLFRTVFFGGLPIVERHAHAYRVYYYEQTASGGHDSGLAGMDATVFVPLVDFKFTNDTNNWLLMETYPTDTSLTWKFYSTSDGRTVDWDTTGPTETVEAPDPSYKENPDLSKGEVKQVDWAAQGADITVHRTVSRDGSVYLQDTFFTHYEPWQAKYEYGPGTEDMPPKD